MPDYNDQTNLSKLACIVNFCRKLGDVLEIISVWHFSLMYIDVTNLSKLACIVNFAETLEMC